MKFNCFAKRFTVALREFQCNSDGAVVMIFIFAILPLLLSVGVAMDYLRVTSAQSALTQAADNGALMAAQAGYQQLNAGNANWSAAAISAGQNAFLANALAIRNVSNVNPAFAVTQTGSNVSAQLTYTANVSTTIMKLVNIPVVAVTKTVVASTTPSSTSSSTPLMYANISLVLDVSPSMAIAATPTDIANLDALTLAQTGTGCSFACHDIDPNPNGTPNASSYSNYQIARNGGVTLRIDTVKSAAQSLTNYVSTASTAGQYSMGLYTMSSLLTTVVPPTTNFSSVSSAIGAIDFDTMSTLVYTLPAPAPANIAPPNGDVPSKYADTDFGAVFAALNTTIPSGGAGPSAASPKQIVVLVTDGLSDVGLPMNSAISATYNYPSIPNFSSGNADGKLTGPIDPSLCASLKQSGVTVAILYVTYLIDPTDVTALYQTLIQSNAPPSALIANLTQCASSPNLFYQANDLPGITLGLTTLFTSATTPPSIVHLTQ